MELGDSYCESCTNPKYLYQLFDIEGCSHTLCKICLSQHISSKVEKNELLIQCPYPGCRNGKLEPAACSPILEEGLFDRWCAALCESAVENKFYCPFKDCSALMINEGVLREAECPHCNRLFCAECWAPWHAGISCGQFQADSGFVQSNEDLVVMDFVKNNPNCKLFVERIDEQCRCGFTFCYGCATEMKANHYCSICKR